MSLSVQQQQQQHFTVVLVMVVSFPQSNTVLLLEKIYFYKSFNFIELHHPHTNFHFPESYILFITVKEKQVQKHKQLIGLRYHYLTHSSDRFVLDGGRIPCLSVIPVVGHSLSRQLISGV